MSNGARNERDNSGGLPDDLAKFRDSYVELFGSPPGLPAARFAFSGEIDPKALRLIEQLRAHAFHSDRQPGRGIAPGAA